MISTTKSNNDQQPRGWEALEIKLKAKGLSAGEIALAKKTFFEGIEVLTKMFLSTTKI